MSTDQVAIVVAEDHPLYRRALTAVLGEQPGWSVVAEAEDGVGAVTAAHAAQPDVVVMDLRLPGLDGIEATRRIAAKTDASSSYMVSTSTAMCGLAATIRRVASMPSRPGSRRSSTTTSGCAA